MLTKSRERVAVAARKAKTPPLLEREAMKQLRFSPGLVQRWRATIKLTKAKLAAAAAGGTDLPWHEDSDLARLRCAETLVRHVKAYAKEWACMDNQRREKLYVELRALGFEAQCRRLNSQCRSNKTPCDVSDELLGDLVASCRPDFVAWLLEGVPVFRRHVRCFPSNQRAKVRSALIEELNGLTPTAQILGLLLIVGSGTKLEEVTDSFPIRPLHVREYRAVKMSGRERQIVAKHSRGRPQFVCDCMGEIVVQLFDLPTGKTLRTKLVERRANDQNRLRRFLDDLFRLIVSGDRSADLVPGFNVRAAPEDYQQLSLPAETAVGAVQTSNVFNGTVSQGIVQEIVEVTSQKHGGNDRAAAAELLSIAHLLTETRALFGSMLFLYLVSKASLFRLLDDLLSTPAQQNDSLLMLKEWPEMRALPEKIVADRLDELRGIPNDDSKNERERVARTRRRLAAALADPERRAKGHPR